jgi:hypothetical protein
MMRQRDLPANGFIKSSGFSKVVAAINALHLEDEVGAIIGFGGEFENEVLHLKKQIFEGEKKVKDLEESLQEMKTKILHLQSFIDESKGNSQLDSSIEDTKNSPLGSTNKKRKVHSICRKVFGDLQDVSERYRETVGCVLGNHFVFGSDEDKDDVRDIVSETLEIVLEANASKKALLDVTHPETYERIMDSMRVPDWVLLYFKLQTQLPDSAWQTLLNLTHLGRGGVCRSILDNNKLYFSKLLF